MCVIDEGILVELAEAAYADPVMFGETVVQRYDWVPFQQSGVEGFIVTIENTAIVVFRGTEIASHIDMLMDLRFLFQKKFHWGGKVHRGFLRSYNRVHDDVFGKLRKCVGGKDPEQIVFCGHSAGGALASLAAAWACFLGHTNSHLVTFGCPRVGNQKWADGIRRRLKSSHRFVNGADLVARVPLYGFCCLPDYRHVDDGTLITKTDHFIANPSWSDSMVEILRRLKRNPSAMLDDHSIGKYRRNIDEWLRHRQPTLAFFRRRKNPSNAPNRCAP